MNILSFRCKLTNCYLIESNNGWIMLDTDWPDTLPALLSILKRLDVKISDIRYLIITHFHPDHAGIAQNLKELGISLILHKVQIPFVRKLNSFFNRSNKYIFKNITEDNNIVVSSSESRKLLKNIGINGELINTPGHSDDSISLIIDNLCVFTGDLPGYTLVEAYNNMAHKESWKLIKSYNVTKVYPSHKNPYDI